LYKLTAKYYDKIYHWKDYKKESEKIKSLIKKFKRSKGKEMLDVACGTGSHIPFLKNQFNITGLDLDKDMLKEARKKLPDIKFLSGDMRTFHLKKKFDVIVCLFSAIAYMHTRAELRKAIRNFSGHLKEGGLMIIEGFIPPKEFKPDLVHGVYFNEPDLKIFRATKATKKGNIMTMDFHILAADRKGVKYINEKHFAAMYDDSVFIDIMKEEKLNTICIENGFMKGRSLFLGMKGRS
jgi:ubiquinone/menaquinone biosynthesis C-methylase UbiE